MAEIKLPNSDQFDQIIEQMKIANREKGQDDFSGSPGGKTLIAGDFDAGFYGFVQPHEFGTIDDEEFDGDSLALAVGISQGSSQFTKTPWLKFSWRRKILLTPLKAIRRSISWDHIYQSGAVYGTGSTISSGEQNMLDTDGFYSEEDRVSQNTQITINGIDYKVRLFRGAGSDPMDSYNNSDRGSAGADNEWNHLMLPLHERAPNNFNNNSYADAPTEDWGFDLTDEIMLTHRDFGNGSYSWCQETIDVVHSDDEVIRRRALRGYNGVAHLSASRSSNTRTFRGWRPVLELL